MRLPKDKSFAGFNALQVRSLLRTLGRGTSTRHHLECTFQLPKAGAQELIDLLVGEGLLVAADPGGFELRIAGAAFAQASAAPPLHRRTVERRLRELVGRMVEINAKSEFLVGIEEAYVYGSYLSAAERLGDLDISLCFYRKDPARFMERSAKGLQRLTKKYGKKPPQRCRRPGQAALISSKNGVRRLATHSAAYRYMAADHVCQSCPRGLPFCALNHSLNPQGTRAPLDGWTSSVRTISFFSAREKRPAATSAAT
jgi:predicted nucleotidyltransferase